MRIHCLHARRHVCNGVLPVCLDRLWLLLPHVLRLPFQLRLVFPLAFQIVPALMLLSFSPWPPYSPRWLLQQGRGSEGQKVIRRLHHIKGDVHETIATKEFYPREETTRARSPDKGTDISA